MKHKTLYLPAIAVLVASFSLLITGGCNKSSSPPTSNSVMTASISGTAFQPSVVAGLDYGSFINVAGLVLKAGDSISIVITFPDNITTNTALSFSDVVIKYTDTKGTFDFESGNSPSNGSVTITSFDKSGLTVAGNFSGVLYDSGTDSVVITNGQFFTKYQLF